LADGRGGTAEARDHSSRVQKIDGPVAGQVAGNRRTRAHIVATEDAVAVRVFLAGEPVS